MQRQPRIKTYPNNSNAIQFLPNDSDMLSDQSMVLTVHYTRGLINDDGTVDHLYVGKKGYNFYISHYLGHQISELARKYKAPLLMNVYFRNGKDRETIVRHALVVTVRPKNEKDDYKPLFNADTLLKLTFRAFEKKRSIVCSLTPAPQAYLERLIDISKN